MLRRRTKFLRDLAIVLVLAVGGLQAVHHVSGADPFATTLAYGAILALLLGGLAARWIIDRTRVEDALRESTERYTELFENANDMVYTHDAEGRFTSMNNAGERLTGYHQDDVSHMRFHSIVAPASQERAQELVEQHLRGQISAISELEFQTKDGRRVPVEVSTRLITREGKTIGVQGIARDIDERKRFEQQLLHLASHDPLTDLFNRRRFEEELHLQLARARRYGTRGALLFLDLDHFKDVNDSLGHWAGDELLAGVAQLLRQRLRETDILARLGGDEFTIILPQSEVAEAREISEDLLVAMRTHAFRVAAQPFTITASIGIASIPDDGTNAGELLSHADLAMYQAKENGRNRVWTFSAEGDWDAQIESRLNWRRRIWQALEEDRFVLYAQPILDLQQNEVSQFELLLRMQDKDGKIIDAATFIDNAQRFGLMPAIDRWVVERSIQIIGEHTRPGREVIIEANISSKAFADKELLPLIRRTLDATGANPRHLVLEVTESAAIASLGEAQQFVRDLKEIGCRFALDDFGVGFSSFSHLKHLDVDYLKIDGSFIVDLPRDPVDQHLVKAIVEVSRALGKETIAEFVGDEETVRLLRRFGVGYAQGYHVGKPRPAAEVLEDHFSLVRQAA